MAGSPVKQGGSPDVNASFVTSSLVGVAISLPILASIATGLRIYARRLKGSGKLRANDWIVLITLVLCWGHSVNTLVAGGIGGINKITMPPQEYANMALRTLWISSFFLVTALYTVKVSILLFYYHLFSITQWFRRSIIIMIAVLTAWWFSSILLILLSTDPISAHWKNASEARRRFSFDHWYLSYSGLSIFFDVIILCFPIPMIKSLQNMNMKRKISILGIFWLGGFVCVAAIIRFVFLYNQIFRITDYGQNQYSAITLAFIWAEIEPNTSVVAACLPIYRPLFREGTIFRKFFLYLGTTFSTTSDRNPRVQRSATSRLGYHGLEDPIERPKDIELSATHSKSGTISEQSLGDVEQGYGDRNRLGIPKARLHR